LASTYNDQKLVWVAMAPTTMIRSLFVPPL
jgi:hypothetical protein